jgi:hypothetical protein
MKIKLWVGSPALQRRTKKRMFTETNLEYSLTKSNHLVSGSCLYFRAKKEIGVLDPRPKLLRFHM